MFCCKNSKTIWVFTALIIGLVAVGYYLKWPLITNNLWILVILVCPLMHLFMGHGGHEAHEASSAQNKTQKPKQHEGGCCH